MEKAKALFWASGTIIPEDKKVVRGTFLFSSSSFSSLLVLLGIIARTVLRAARARARAVCICLSCDGVPRILARMPVWVWVWVSP